MLPSNIDNWNPAMRGAYMKGRQACANGKQLTDCPYKDIRKPSGKLSWSRAFMNAWRDGFTDKLQETEQ